MGGCVNQISYLLDQKYVYILNNLNNDFINARQVLQLFHKIPFLKGMFPFVKKDIFFLHKFGQG